MNAYESLHISRLRKHLAECTVLLKKSGAFPLEAPCAIAAYGSGVRRTIKGGSGSGEVNSRYFTTIEQGLKDAGFRVTSGEWLDGYDHIVENARKEFRQEIFRRARKNHRLAVVEGFGAVMPEPECRMPLNAGGEAAIYVVSRISGEGNDRRDIEGDARLTTDEIRDIIRLNRRFSRFMLVLNVGGPVDLSPVEEVEDVLVLSQLGVETGAVLADILLGKANPSGKLATTWSKAEDYCPEGGFGDINDTDYREGVYVGYRYFDTVGKRAMFPFGFGLSYTSFSVGNGEVTADGNKVTVSATVRNTGAKAGKTVLQVYVSSPEGELDKPYQSLAAWVKTPLLLPGEEETVSTVFGMDELASFSEKSSAWVLEKGNYVVRIGESSTDTSVAAVLRLSENVTLEKVRPAFGASGFKDMIPVCVHGDVPAGVGVIEVSAKAIPVRTPVYGKEPEPDKSFARLSDKELCLLNIGAFDPKGGLLNVVGDASLTVAGAAGESCGLYKKLGLKPLVMADGPAGLRLSTNYFKDKKGAHSVNVSMPQSMADFLPGYQKLLLTLMSPKAPKDAEILEQYTTALPIGTAIAQSWNLEFAALCGDIVGDEMERFNVDLWLAPALNIHRSILCGRNFEYYSEDPLVSGRFTAAITNAVQKHPGKGTTIKHYAANNQETNRYYNSSNVSERAMREIYLRGFGIAVRESQPAALMTSYNLINGLHTSESRALTEDILRGEFGFEGMVMTDWVVPGSFTGSGDKYGPPNAAKVAAAGCSFFMPGCGKDLKEMQQGLKDGTISRRQLMINAGRVKRLIG